MRTSKALKQAYTAVYSGVTRSDAAPDRSADGIRGGGHISKAPQICRPFEDNCQTEAYLFQDIRVQPD